MSSSVASVGKKEYRKWTEQDLENLLNELDQRFIAVPMAVFADVTRGKIKAPHFFVYAYLLYVQGKHDNLWMGFEKLTSVTGYKKSQLSCILKELEEAGHIRRQKRFKGASWTYCLTYLKGGKIIVRDSQYKPEANPKNSAQENKQEDSRCIKRTDELFNIAEGYSVPLWTNGEILLHTKKFEEGHFFSRKSAPLIFKFLLINAQQMCEKEYQEAQSVPHIRSEIWAIGKYYFYIKPETQVKFVKIFFKTALGTAEGKAAVKNTFLSVDAMQILNSEYT